MFHTLIAGVALWAATAGSAEAQTASETAQMTTPQATQPAMTQTVKPEKKRAQKKQKRQTKQRQKQKQKQAQHNHVSEERREALRRRAAWAWHWRNAPPWAYGVFLHPHHHHGSHAAQASTSQRSVDRTGALSIGIRGGTYLGAYTAANRARDTAFSDFGLGVAARARIAEPLGLEVSWANHDQTFEAGSARVTQPLSASIQLFVVPWATVSPFIVTGVTWTNRNYDDTYFDGLGQQTVRVQDQLFGPHVGIGLEFNVSESTSLSFEGKRIAYLNVEEADPTIPASLQGTMGLNLHF